MKVLIVDDRAENQLLLQEQLRPLGAESVTVDNGMKALRELRAQAFDLVVTDLLMPEMDGFQLCYLLKTDPKLKSTPVVIYTANYATKKDEEQAKSLGADDFLTRPIDEELLNERIRRVLERAAMGRITEPKTKPEEGFFREYSSLLVEKLEDQLITAEENARLLARNVELQREIEKRNADLTSANAELTRVNEDLESYTYSVSHDLRAPVRAIGGMAELLQEELAPVLTPAARKFLERIQYNVARMNLLISGLLEHHRMRDVGAGLEPVDLEAVIQTALAGLDFAIRTSGAKIDVVHPLPAVIAHEQGLVQIVTNLVDNAMKFVERGRTPEIRIWAEGADSRVRLAVRDNGIGLPKGAELKLFKIFERLHGNDEYPGTGLGLAIVRRGIEGMGGRVWVESVQGQGSTFWLELAAP
jgi:signal transduction histidine kinase